MDRIIPGDEQQLYEEDEIDTNDMENKERLLDDDFQEVEIVAQKEKELEDLRKQNLEQQRKIEAFENKEKVMEGESKKPKGVNNVPVHLPNQWQHILFKQDGKSERRLFKVMTKHKQKSTYRNIIGLRFEDGTEEAFDFSKAGIEWQDSKEAIENMNDACCLHSFAEDKNIIHDTFVTVLTRSQVKGRKDADEAMKAEIAKFEKFSAFRKVVDEGQYAIKTRWVFSEDKENSKGCLLKARLCMRGDTELNTDTIRADSPTAHKDSIKLALAIAANENFEIISADIKSAFLQGKSLNRKVYVLPPSEANNNGKLWLLEKAAYGLIDGSRLFYLELKGKLEKLGMKDVSGDPGMFTMHKDGKLTGIVCSHVDDLFMAGNVNFKSSVVEKLLKLFQFSKVERKKFKYLGCEVEKLNNGDITLNDYIEKIKEVEIPSGRNSHKVNETERKIIRRVVGELLWVSLMTRPNLSFEVNKLSSDIMNATIKELKDAKRLVEKAKLEPIVLNFTKLGHKDNLRIKLFTDASFNNQDGKLKSTEGRVLVLENLNSSKFNVFSCKTKKISRICRSVKGAETRALENGLDEAVHFARMLHEIYEGEVNLKQPKQIEVNALTDNKGLWENLNNTRQCDEKLLRNSIALIKQMVENREVKRVDWIETGGMLADALTKLGGNGRWFKDVISRNNLEP